VSFRPGEHRFASADLDAGAPQKMKETPAPRTEDPALERLSIGVFNWLRKV
jgi:hypothetical protein